VTAEYAVKVGPGKQVAEAPRITVKMAIGLAIDSRKKILRSNRRKQLVKDVPAWSN
jgi:hypothetical protein